MINDITATPYENPNVVTENEMVLNGVAVPIAGAAGSEELGSVYREYSEARSDWAAVRARYLIPQAGVNNSSVSINMSRTTDANGNLNPLGGLTSEAPSLYVGFSGERIEVDAGVALNDAGRPGNGGLPGQFPQRWVPFLRVDSEYKEIASGDRVWVQCQAGTVVEGAPYIPATSEFGAYANMSLYYNRASKMVTLRVSGGDFGNPGSVRTSISAFVSGKVTSAASAFRAKRLVTLAQSASASAVVTAFSPRVPNTPRGYVRTGSRAAEIKLELSQSYFQTESGGDFPTVQTDITRPTVANPVNIGGFRAVAIQH